MQMWFEGCTSAGFGMERSVIRDNTAHGELSACANSRASKPRVSATHNAGSILAMKKRNYRAQKVNEVRWEAMSQRVEGKALVFAVDVAKVEQYGVLMDGTPS